MGFIYGDKNQNWTLIHSAYGTELKGKRGTWLSMILSATMNICDDRDRGDISELIGELIMKGED